jgi:LysM repeat protein
MYHYVSKGETLNSIAKRYRSCVNNLIRLNPQIHNPNLIYPGQKIRVR